MSAIWGCVKLDKSVEIPSNASAKMRELYEKKCKIDRVEELSFRDGFFACGIQYVTPLAFKEELPCKNDDGLYFTADCMIDNGDRSIPDGKFLFNAFSKKGPDCLKEILGVYAVAAWDEKNRLFYLCADPAASRCIYYYNKDGLLVFSTLIEPIRSIFPNIEINENYLKDFLIAPTLVPNIVAAESAFLGVNKVIQGEYKVFTAEKVESVKYFDPSIYNKNMHLKSIKQVDKTFRSLYEKCVSDLIRNEIIGIAMSSGLDSSSIAVLTADKIKKDGHGRLLAYTYVPSIKVRSPLGFVTDETNAVMEIVNKNPKIEPHFLNNEGRNCVEQVTDVVSLTEMPIKALVNFPNLLELYKKAADEGCRIVLNGQTGNITVSNGKPDDVFYNLYKKHHYVSLFICLFRLCHALKAKYIKSYRNFLKAFKEYIKQEKNPEKIWNVELFNKYLNKKIYNNYPVEERFSCSGYENAEITPMDENKYRKSLINHPSFVYIGEIETKMGLQNGIVIRDPTRDARMISFCYKLPYQYFVYMGMPRCLIRRNLKDLIPNKILRNWRRYGEQNADWLLRIKRDKDSVIKTLSEAFGTDFNRDYVCKSEIQEEVRKYSFDQAIEENDLNSILFIFSVLKFMRLYQ